MNESFEQLFCTIETLMSMVDNCEFKNAKEYLEEKRGIIPKKMQLIVNSLFSFFIGFEKQNAIQMLELNLPTVIENQYDVRLYYYLLMFYVETNQYDKIEELLPSLESNLNLISNKFLLSKIYYNIANAYITLNNFQLSIIYTDKSLDISFGNNFINLNTLASLFIKAHALKAIDQKQSSYDACELYKEYAKILDKGRKTSLAKILNKYMKEIEDYVKISKN